MRRLSLRRIAVKEPSSLRVTPPVFGRPHDSLAAAADGQELESPQPQEATAHSMSHVSLQHIKPGRSTGCKRRRVCLVPPSGFGYPLGGLLPAKPCRPFFMPTALLGLNPSKRSPLAGWYRVSTITAPTYCFSRAYSACDKHKLAGHTGRSFWVPVRRESLAPLPVLGASSTGCSRGLWCLPGLTG